MHIVALTRLAGTVEQEATALAKDLGGVAYEHRLKLAAGMPAIVLTTGDEARAESLAAALRKRGHGVVRFADHAIIPRSDMVALRRFALEPDALASLRVPAARIPWTDIAVLVRSTLRETDETTKVETKKQIAVGKAVLSGGLMPFKNTKQETTSRTTEIQGVLYLFPRTSGAPWLVLEQQTEFEPLGDAITTSSSRNFTLLVDRLRVLARGAAYDDRLVARRVPAAELDTYAYLVALSCEPSMATPFR